MTVWRKRALEALAGLLCLGIAGLIGSQFGSTTVINRSAATRIAPVKAQATLPASSQDPLIKNLKIGQTAYTVPWGMWEDTHRRAWLNPDYDVTWGIEGTSHMKIRREADGFHVWITQGDSEEKYAPEKSPYYVGENGPWIPVRHLTVS